jgi:hypothetical protein
MMFGPWLQKILEGQNNHCSEERFGRLEVLVNNAASKIPAGVNKVGLLN